MKRILIISIAVWVGVLAASAQRNVYVNENVDGYNRVRIVNGVERIDFGPDSMTVLYDGVAVSSFGTSTVGAMGFREIDPWRAKFMPEKYWADFDFDITFEEADKESCLLANIRFFRFFANRFYGLLVKLELV